MMAKSDSVMVHRISSEELEELMESCTQKASSGQRGFIYPGTKWCGPGNIAKHFDDVGRYEEEDKCCREHDHCPKQLGAGQCRYGICNKSLFTRQVHIETQRRRGAHVIKERRRTAVCMMANSQRMNLSSESDADAEMQSLQMLL
ncbi:unnamed protein product [Timema podura]|uniref:phospholipase A2 n=1 Tax=Timema podura TaxID=61482 RepID=A0ABN7PLJ1_TIMPD|nr:unnamed protein product [Timema podura]